jgi:DNA helicase II / ATP-dependent DNA helicase PcrA
VPSRFLEEIPSHLMEDLTRGQRPSRGAYAKRDEWESPRHYSYEDEDQRPRSGSRSEASRAGASRAAQGSGSLDNIAQFFNSRKSSGTRPKLDIPAPNGVTGFRSGQRVRHPKYGEGVVFRREGDGDDAKITVQFAGVGVKKLVEKFAQLEKV